MNMHMNSTSDFCDTTMPMVMEMSGFQSAWNVGPHESCLVYLFQSWVIDSKGKYIAAVCGTFLFGVLLEGFGFLRKMYAARYTPEAALGKRVTKAELRHFVPSALYGVQMLLAYFCMLVVMLYESLILAALVVGLSVGNAVFGVWFPIRYNSLITPQRAAEQMVVNDKDGRHYDSCTNDDGTNDDRVDEEHTEKTSLLTTNSLNIHCPCSAVGSA